MAPGLDLPLLANSRHFQVDGGIQDGRQKAGRDGTAEESLFAAQPAQVRGRQVERTFALLTTLGKWRDCPSPCSGTPARLGLA